MSWAIGVPAFVLISRYRPGQPMFKYLFDPRVGTPLAEYRSVHAERLARYRAGVTGPRGSWSPARRRAGGVAAGVISVGNGRRMQYASAR